MVVDWTVEDGKSWLACGRERDGAGGRGAVCLGLVGLWAGEDGAGGRGAVCLGLVGLWSTLR